MFYHFRNSLFAFVVFAIGVYFTDREEMNEEKYSIKVEWFDNMSSLVRHFTLFYFPADKTVEMYDIAQKRTFLKRTPCDTVSESDLYISNTISVFGRELKLTEYLNEATSKTLQSKAERTYAMLKPEVIPHMGKILSFIEGRGFRFNRMMLTKFTANRAAEFYKEHNERPFYEKLVNYVSSGPVLAMELLAPSAISQWRTTLGPTDPVAARHEAPNSIRALFGTDTTQNAAHGSDSPQSAQRELSLVFNNLTSHLIPSESSTLCLVKPHILSEGKLGSLITAIQEKNYVITGLRIHRLTPAEADQFFQAYKGVWDDYLTHIKHFISGPSVALSIESDVNTFRDFVGPFDPEIARKLHPNSLRARFGHDTAHNALHCTDLSDDGAREVGLFH